MSARALVPAKPVAAKARTLSHSPSALLQRKCDCGGSASFENECEECKKKRLQRRAAGNGPSIAPPIVHQVLCSPGQPLDPATRSFFEPRFGHDFSKVRVHTDQKAAESAHAVNALAYTVGSDIAFAAGRYTPADKKCQRLLAHELTHVVQQSEAGVPHSNSRLTVEQAGSPPEMEARRIESLLSQPGSRSNAGSNFQVHHTRLTVSRADPAAVEVTMHLGTAGRTPRTGLQLVPSGVTDTRVGPVTAQGGLLSGGINRLSVIVGENLTLRAMARVLLPLWTTATPFTPPGGGAPLPPTQITEDDLAKGLLVYNQNFLPVPKMTNWKAGLRFPLPVEVDNATHIGTVHPATILSMAGLFDPAWLPLLDRKAATTVAVPAQTLAADVTAFLAQQTTTTDRGLQLSSRIKTNATAELPFLRETFNQLGGKSFDVALAFMDGMVNPEVAAMAAQRDGAAALAIIRTALAGAPAKPTPAQSQSLARANQMLGLVAGVAASAPPTAAGSRLVKTVTIDTVKLDGSNHNPGTDVAVANGILTQCNVRLIHGTNATASHAETTSWLGGNTNLRGSNSCGSASADELNVFRHASARFGLTARIRAFFPATISGLPGAAGYSIPPFCATGTGAAILGMVVLANTSDTEDLAHETGHILLNSGAHPVDTEMSPSPPRRERFTDAQCNTIYRNA